jgi:hypothetical protein
MTAGLERYELACKGLPTIVAELACKGLPAVTISHLLDAVVRERYAARLEETTAIARYLYRRECWQ